MGLSSRRAGYAEAGEAVGRLSRRQGGLAMIIRYVREENPVLIVGGREKCG